ncbi:Uncharacterised protein [Segatella copri]|nr:Uncharacterised protein [Segatella copri]
MPFFSAIFSGSCKISLSGLSFGFQAKDREKSFIGSVPKENFGVMLERKVFAI